MASLTEAIEFYKTYRAYAFLAGVNNVVCLYKEHEWKFDERVADYVIYGGHQNRVVNGKYFKYKHDTLEPAEKALLSPPDIIRPYSDFEDLYHEVKKRLRRIPNIGDLTYYDAALRLGFLLDDAIFPKDKVYVYAGAWIGLKGLQAYLSRIKMPLKRNITSAGIYDTSDFMPHFGGMESMFIEDFLCVFDKLLDHLDICTKKDLLKTMEFHGTHKKIKDCFKYNYDIK